MGFREDFQSSPTLYPLGLDLKADAVQFVQLARADFDALGFHDRRMLTPQTKTAWARWPQVQDAARGLPVRANFIFHISHVGSTLLSRLLGAHPQVFALREPGVMRSFADAQLSLGTPESPWPPAEFDQRLSLWLGIWSRTFSPQQTALIKCTSYVSEMAELLMDRVAASRSIFMYVSPAVFLPALLGGAMVDIEGRAASRLTRLHKRLGETPWSLASLSPGEKVSMSWLSEMLALGAAAVRFDARCQWLDFDAFLASPEPRLVASMHHLGLTDPAAHAAPILAGPLMKQYSKATHFEFDAGARQKILQESRAKHADEIARGLAWMDHAAAKWPQVQQLMERLVAT
ncbi:MAG: hypothetical protein GC200_00065 [Tepidisphaera sp.]|nr:hypothetical protein [Tepidisphaera sp.]